MVAVKSLWVLLKSLSTNFSFKRDSGVRVPDHKPDKRIRYNRLRPQWHRPYYPSTDTDKTRNGNTPGNSSSYNSSKAYQDYLNGNDGDNPTGKFGGSDDDASYNKDFENFINSDSDYEDGDSDADDFDDDFTTTDEDEDSDLDEDEDDSDEVISCEVCDRTFPTVKKLADHQEKKRHYGCSHCDSIFTNRKALEFHKEEADHLDIVSDYGTDDTRSYSSGSVGEGNSSFSSASSGRGATVCEGKCCQGTSSNSKASSGSSNGRQGAQKSSANNNNYHCYGNQLHACWYEGDDEEEKGLLKN